MRNTRNKLRSRLGMTLTELLVALLILALVTLGVGTGVSAALRSYRQSVAQSDAAILASTLSSAIMDELRFARDYDSTDNTFTSDTYGQGVKIGAVRLDNDTSPNEAGFLVVANTNGESVSERSDLERHPLLVSSGAYPGDLRAKAVLSGGAGSPIEVELFIYAGADEIRKVEFSVQPLNP